MRNGGVSLPSGNIDRALPPALAHPVRLALRGNRCMATRVRAAPHLVLNRSALMRINRGSGGGNYLLRDSKFGPWRQHARAVHPTGEQQQEANEPYQQMRHRSRRCDHPCRLCRHMS